VTFLFYILATLLIYLSYKSFRGGMDFLRYFKQEIAKPLPDHAPFATIFAPCKGVDQGMQENFDALLQQEYPEYEIIFIVDESDDPAAAVIESAWREGRRQVKLVVAPASIESSQKVENLREGVAHADPRSEVFAFVDSDTRPSRTWLRNLVAPLKDGGVGAATGYRWFISRHPTFASEMRSVWNASISSALGPNTKSNFCWGGSMAIRRDTFERLGIREQWRGTLSDDFAVTRALNAAGMPIVFVPQALTASIEDCNFLEMLEFTTRQMKITRVYAAHLWRLSFFGSGLFNTVMISAFAIVLFSRQNSLAVWFSVATIILVSIFSIGKSWLRSAAVKLVLKEQKAALGAQFLPQVTLWLLAPAVFLYNCAAALFSRRIAWRGTTYEMVSTNVTRVVNPRPER
jgi:cellulose synthase/poly-beta-1,6-N-acetylglucosamine synthase-like glycosyltransferase